VIAFFTGSGEDGAEDENCKVCRKSAGRIGKDPDCTRCDKGSKEKKTAKSQE
jgi:hypothetical protein